MRYVENLDDTVTDHTGGGDIHANYQIRNRTCKTNEKANARNSAELSKMRTAIKKFEKAKTAGAEDVEKLYREAVSAVDRAHSKGLIKANKARVTSLVWSHV